MIVLRSPGVVPHFRSPVQLSQRALAAQSEATPDPTPIAAFTPDL